jgi:exonuclease SbcC
MRPLQLHITAFGSYPGAEHIDFAVLAELGLFTVTGPTGAGKSTIFDAMTFALYGDVAGDRQARDMRSHHAAAGTLTEVTFEFEVDGTRYRVHRTPSQDRPRKTGSGTTLHNTTAEFARWESGAWVVEAAQAGSVTKRCIELLGLTAPQFQQVVLLPQGRFSEFLLAKTSDRLEVLRQLFGSHLYVAAVDEMRAEAYRLDAEVKDVRAEIERHRLNALDQARQMAGALGADPSVWSLADDATVSDIEAAVTALDADRAALSAAAEQARVAADDARRSADDAEAAAERFDRAAEHRTTLAALRERDDEITATERSVAAARRTRPVVAAARSAADAADALEHVRANEQAAVAALRTAATDVGIDVGDSSDSATAAVTHRRAALDLDRQRLAAVAAASEQLAWFDRAHGAAVTEVERLDAEVAQRTAEYQQFQQRHADAAAAAVGAESLRHAATSARAAHTERCDLDEAATELAEAQRAAQQASDRADALLVRFIDGVAPRLAASLVEGEACPVCGSIEHPSPAAPHPQDGEVDAATLDAALAASAAAQSAVAGLVERVRRSQQALGDLAHQSVDALDTTATAAELAAAAAERAVVERDRLVGETARIDQVVTVAKTDAAAARHIEIERGAEVRGARSTLDAALVAATGLDDARIAAETVGLDHMVELIATWSVARSQAADAQVAADIAERSAAEALASSGVTDLAAAGVDALDGTDLEALDLEVSRHRAAIVDAQVSLRELEAMGVPTHRPEVEPARDHARQLAQHSDALAGTSVVVQQRYDDLVRSIGSARTVDDGAADLIERRNVAMNVYQVCNANTGRRIGLETWVLAAELDRVTASATVHLQRMSKGRYALSRAVDGERGNQRNGLELAVFDAHTGQSRAPVTLSGGERFQASLSLALGLADVVSQGGSGSGRVFEALFVDEGFGSLDPESLDDAIDALTHLRASGRMVGAITHVEAMKQQLPTGIEVRRRPAGGGSTIVQPGVRV